MHALDMLPSLHTTTLAWTHRGSWIDGLLHSQEKNHRLQVKNHRLHGLTQGRWFRKTLVQILYVRPILLRSHLKLVADLNKVSRAGGAVLRVRLGLGVCQAGERPGVERGGRRCTRRADVIEHAGCVVCTRKVNSAVRFDLREVSSVKNSLPNPTP